VLKQEASQHVGAATKLHQYKSRNADHKSWTSRTIRKERLSVYFQPDPKKRRRKNPSRKARSLGSELKEYKETRPSNDKRTPAAHSRATPTAPSWLTSFYLALALAINQRVDQGPIHVPAKSTREV